MTEQIRKSRELETREATGRPNRWRPPQLLPDPKPEPGYAFRWIRIATLGKDDPTNLNSKLQEGWEPVKASDHPEIRLFGSSNKDFPGSIVTGGLILCKSPVEFIEQRDEYFQNQSENQMNSVDNTFMRESNPKMPLFKERSSSVTFGKGI
jgi:hypothetical protein